MKKNRMLNVGCGSKFHKDWVNIDMISNSEYVIAANLFNGIPFPDNCFEIVYHSQVLEHLPKEKATDFIKECFRVLKPDGIIRVVVPDLENIVDEYKKALTENIVNGTDLSEANYDWILLEMYDQTVRNFTGGQMAEFLQQKKMINEKYVVDRRGFVGRTIRNDFLSKTTNSNRNPNIGLNYFIKRGIRFVKRKIKNILTNKQKSKEYKIGKFRLSGEVHMWMYDRYSLSRLLRKTGFSSVKIKSPHESDIPNWSLYGLDVKDGLAYDPGSLFIEARKEHVK